MPEHDDGWRRQILHFLETEPDKCTAMVINWCAKKRRIDIPGGPEQVAEYVCAMARDHFRYEDLTDAERAATEPHTAYWKRIDSILSASRQRYSRRANFAREQKMVGNVHWLRPTHNDGRLDREFIAFVRGQDPNLGPVDSYLEFMTPAQRLIIAANDVSVLQARIAMRLNSLSFWK